MIISSCTRSFRREPISIVRVIFIKFKRILLVFTADLDIPKKKNFMLMKNTYFHISYIILLKYTLTLKKLVILKIFPKIVFLLYRRCEQL